MEKFVFGESASNSLVGVIREAILDGRFVPGTLISTSSLAQDLGVSRTPVREALLQLAQAGMVQFEKNRGVRVMNTSIADLIGVFQVRLLIEVPLVARAAETATEEDIAEVEITLDAMRAAAAEQDYEAFLRADRDFHLTLLKIADSPRAVAVVRDLRNVVLTRGVGTVPNSRSPEDILREHRVLLDSVKAHDPVGAAAGIRSHILNTAHLLISQESHNSAEYPAERISEVLDWVGEIGPAR
ncbi:MAG: GntR family transcriptional regulator [Microterricola sp.]